MRSELTPTQQANDDQLENMAKRIRARATRRAGELLKQVEPSKGGRPAETNDGTVSSFSRKSAAAEAGLSERQAYTAQRLANVPDDTFEEMVEAGATITAIAEAGTARREPDRGAAKALVAAIRLYAERISSVDLEAAADAMSDVQRAEVRMLVARLDGIHDKLVTSI